MPQTFLQPGQTLLALLRFSARSKADKLIQNGGLNLYPDPYVNASYTTQELNLALNTSMGEYADVLATEFGNYYDTAWFTFLTDGTNEFFPLPNNWLKNLGIMWQQSPPGDDNNIPLQRLSTAQIL